MQRRRDSAAVPDDRSAPDDGPVPVDGAVSAVFEPARGWGSGHLQTLRSRIRRRRYPLHRVGSQRGVLVDLGDGDRLALQLHCARLSPVGRHRGLVLLVHGLGGSAESSYMRATAYGLLEAGFNVARLDLRSAGLSAPTTAQMYHAGRTDDLRAVLQFLATQPEGAVRRGGSQLFVIGFSLGGAATIKLLGEPGLEPSLRAGVVVSASLDLVAGAVHLSAVAFGVYERFLLRGLRRDARRPGPGGVTRLSSAEARAIDRARSLAQFDDAVTAPRNGWRDSQEYYQVNSALPFLQRIRVPTLVIHALDDPMIPSDPYRSVDWAMLAAITPVRGVITPRGGHVGFHAQGRDLPWFVDQAVRFLASVDGSGVAG